MVKAHCESRGVRAETSTAFVDGGAGAEALARTVVEELRESDPKFLYSLESSYPEKLEAIAGTVYGAQGVVLSSKAARTLRKLDKEGLRLPICMAKTPLSLSDDSKKKGRPSGFKVNVRDVRLSAGAGFVVALLGDVMTMPGLPKKPAAAGVTIDAAGEIHGLMQEG